MANWTKRRLDSPAASTTIIGFRHEKAGHHTQVVPSAVASEGKWAIRVWPELGKKRLIRAWAGLRVMPDDSMAIYSRLPGHPNVTLVNTHSAVTMAAAHTRLLPEHGGGDADPGGDFHRLPVEGDMNGRCVLHGVVLVQYE